MNRKALAAVFLCGVALVGSPARPRADSIARSTANGLVSNNLPGGNLPKRNGTYNLRAEADDSEVAGIDVKKKGPAPYGPATNQNPMQDTSGMANQTGVAYDPKAEAVIKYGAAKWSSNGSYADLNATNKKNAGESASARADVRDPWNFGVFDVSDTLLFDVTFFGGSMIDALAGPTESTFASFSSTGADLTPNGLGALWSFLWSTNSANPGVSSVSFTSNPMLGLDDTAIEAAFKALVSGNPSTGLSTLTSDFTFHFQIPVLAGTQPEFTANFTNEVAGAQGGEVPEPATVLLLGSGLVAACVRRRTTSRRPAC